MICGVDEAGRGPLCGSVVAAAVILDPARPIAGLADSKKLSERQRERLAALIRSQALAWSVAEACVEEIDRLNILHATMLAMKRAVEGLAITPLEALVTAIAARRFRYRHGRSSRAMHSSPLSRPRRFWPRPPGTSRCVRSTFATRNMALRRTKGIRPPHTLPR